MIFGRTPELVSGKTPEEYRDFFAAVFADLDANPRKSGVKFAAEDLTIDVVQGNPVFIVGEESDSPQRLAADFRSRWLPEHPVPLKFTDRKIHTLRFIPTTGNRVKVRS